MARVHLLAVRGVDTVVACSSTVADDVAGFVSDIRVVRNGVDASKYSPRDNFEGVREELNLGTDVPVFLSIGGLNQRKDPLFLIRGFNEADIEGHLLLVGEGPLREECERLAGESVTVAGFVDSTLPYLQSSDYFVSASGAEGLPLAVVEGMACGLPVVLSDIGPHREILSLDSRAGELFRKHTPEGFADAVRSAVARDYQTMSCAVRNVVKKELNAEVMGREYSAIYREVCQ
jgi:glycosyltransferase involved in cell wall biosynthesis